MRRFAPYLALLAVLAALVLLLSCLPGWFWHPLAPQVCRAQYHTAAQIRDCLSYNAWSGVFGSFLTSMPGWIAALALLWFHHNCHERRCLAIVRTGRTHCKRHQQ